MVANICKKKKKNTEMGFLSRSLYENGIISILTLYIILSGTAIYFVAAKTGIWRSYHQMPLAYKYYNEYNSLVSKCGKSVHSILLKCPCIRRVELDR